MKSSHAIIETKRNYSPPPLGQNPVTSLVLADSIAGELVGRHGAIAASG
jgi:hypothetical protein